MEVTLSGQNRLLWMLWVQVEVTQLNLENSSTRWNDATVLGSDSSLNYDCFCFVVWSWSSAVSIHSYEACDLHSLLPVGQWSWCKFPLLYSRCSIQPSIVTTMHHWGKNYKWDGGFIPLIIILLWYISWDQGEWPPQRGWQLMRSGQKWGFHCTIIVLWQYYRCYYIAIIIYF